MARTNHLRNSLPLCRPPPHHRQRPPLPIDDRCNFPRPTPHQRPYLRHAAPLAAEPAGNPTSATIVLEMSNIADSPALMQWAGDAGKVCAEWYPIVCRFLATDEWTRPKEIVLAFRRGLKVPALTGGNRMEFDAQWITDHPDDFGMVIHELTHVIQAYPTAGDEPGWLVEGTAASCAYSTKHCATARTPKHCGHK